MMMEKQDLIYRWLEEINTILDTYQGITQGQKGRGPRVPLQLQRPWTAAQAGYVLMVVHRVLIEAHAARRGAGPGLLSPGPWGTTDPQQAAQEGDSEQLQGPHGYRYLGGGEHRR